MANDVVRETSRRNPEVLTRSGGVFWGIVLFLFGIIWLLGALGIIQLAPNFASIAVGFLIVVAGVYLVISKLVR